jgi:hypothetical protein
LRENELHLLTLCSPSPLALLSHLSDCLWCGAQASTFSAIIKLVPLLLQ